MATIEAKLTSKGQITLPIEIRDRLNVGPGDSVVFVEDHGKIVVRSRTGTLEDMRGMLRGKITVPKGADIDRWIDEVCSRALSRRLKRRKGRR
jgi:AbrB family looped-hinge helix DNA binding protein